MRMPVPRQRMALRLASRVLGLVLAAGLLGYGLWWLLGPLPFFLTEALVALGWCLWPLLQAAHPPGAAPAQPSD